LLVLGHIQRGGSPTSNDRFIASQMGSLAVEAIISGQTSKVTVVQNGTVKLEELANCVLKNDVSFSEFKALAEKLSI